MLGLFFFFPFADFLMPSKFSSTKTPVGAKVTLTRPGSECGIVEAPLPTHVICWVPDFWPLLVLRGQAARLPVYLQRELRARISPVRVFQAQHFELGVVRGK